MTLFYANHQITIYRNRRKGITNRYGMSATFTGYPADIQPASPQRQQVSPGRWVASFTAFVDSSDNIQEGDQIHSEDGKVYSVKGVKTWEGGAGFAELDHLELTMTALDA